MKQPIALIILVLILLSATAPGSAQSPADPWKIHVDEIDPAHYYGETVANGMIGIVSSAQPLVVKDIVLNGAYDLYGRGRVSNIMQVFHFLNMQLEVDGQPMDAENISHVTQSLDMKTAQLTVAFDYADKLHMRCTYLALRQLPYTAMVQVTIQARKDITVTPASLMQAPDILHHVQHTFRTIHSPKGVIPLLTATAQSPTGKLLVAASNSFLFPEKERKQPVVVWDSSQHLIQFDKPLRQGESYSFSVAGSVLSSADHDDPLNDVERLTLFAVLQGQERLIRLHQQAWAALWESDIIIEGDATAQQDVHSALYHLYSFVRANTAFSISPMGLSGLGYNGHIFWDAELWMYPVLLILQPEMAKSMMEYRFERLQAARKNALMHGYKGAMYPWESARTGGEETPVWALTGPFEHHITACVAIAAWNYFCVTQDTTWLRTKGYPILKETAAFWQSRVEKDPQGRYNINNVVAADEWAENVDNDAFTNAAAKTNLNIATTAAKILGEPAPAAWQQIADNIPILQFPDGVTQEFAGYQGQKVKQADVSLLAYPLDVITDRSQIHKNLQYYEPRIGDGPAMSYSVLAILYERLGKAEKAYQLFQRSYRPNQKPPFGVLAETAGGQNLYFATGAGGMLQAVLNGFAGLQITPQGIRQLQTVLPRQWKSVTITGAGSKGNTYRVGQGPTLKQ